MNDLHLRASRRDTINAAAFGAGCCCLGTHSCKKYFDDRLSSGFSEWP